MRDENAASEEIQGGRKEFRGLRRGGDLVGGRMKLKSPCSEDRLTQFCEFRDGEKIYGTKQREDCVHINKHLKNCVAGALIIVGARSPLGSISTTIGSFN
jgi:hypothetical protein